MTKQENVNPLLYRYPVNSRFLLKGTFNGQSISPDEKVEVGESVTDKETYRLNTASKRGAIGSIKSFGDFSNSKAYMFPDGKYDSTKDFSVLLRKDLSIVELDEIINTLTEKQKSADAEIADEINEQLELAKKIKSEKVTSDENVDKTGESSD